MKENCQKIFKIFYFNFYLRTAKMTINREKQQMSICSCFLLNLPGTGTFSGSSLKLASLQLPFRLHETSVTREGQLSSFKVFAAAVYCPKLEVALSTAQWAGWCNCLTALAGDADAAGVCVCERKTKSPEETRERDCLVLWGGRRMPTNLHPGQLPPTGAEWGCPMTLMSQLPCALSKGKHEIVLATWANIELWV